MNNYEINKYREAFQLFDQDNSGKISVQELGEIFKKFDTAIDENELQMRLKEIDTNENGEIDFEEFLSILSKEDDLLCQFRVVDLNNDGYITEEELFKVMNNLGVKLSESQVQAMVASVDKDGDGRINYNEFVALNKTFLKQ